MFTFKIKQESNDTLKTNDIYSSLNFHESVQLHNIFFSVLDKVLLMVSEYIHYF